jgi:hypothetical protein
MSLFVFGESFPERILPTADESVGKTPMQTFIESKKLAHDRELDRIKPTW